PGVTFLGSCSRLPPAPHADPHIVARIALPPEPDSEDRIGTSYSREIQMSVRDWKIGAKLTTSFLAVAVLCALVGAQGLRVMSHLQQNTESMYGDRVVPLQQLKTVSDMYAVNIVDTDHKLRDGQVSWDEAVKRITAAHDTIAEQWKTYKATLLTDD